MSLRLRLALILGSGAVATLVLGFWRHFPWHLAAFMGIMVAALVYTTFATVERLRDMYRR